MTVAISQPKIYTVFLFYMNDLQGWIINTYMKIHEIINSSSPFSFKPKLSQAEQKEANRRAESIKQTDALLDDPLLKALHTRMSKKR